MTGSVERLRVELGERAYDILIGPELIARAGDHILPLMRRKPGCAEECGLLYDVFHLTGRTGFSATVFDCNLFQLPGSEEVVLVSEPGRASCCGCDGCPANCCRCTRIDSVVEVFHSRSRLRGGTESFGIRGQRPGKSPPG